MAEPYAFRMRAHAAAHFDFEEVLTVTWKDAEAKLQSEYTGGEDGHAYPVTIHGEIRGYGDSLEEAQPRLASMIGNTLPLLALAGNAAVADPLPIAIHGLDLANPQPFLGYATPSPSEWTPPGNRRYDLEATLALMVAVGNHPQTVLLHRSIESYRRTLSHWVPEQRLLAGEYLYIATETLSRFMIEARASARGMTPKNLARLAKLPTEAALRRSYVVDEMFGGDDAPLGAMQTASDGFEHGYMAVDDVRGLLEPVLERSMNGVRATIIRESGMPDAMQSRLLAPDFEEPRGLVPMIRVVQGVLEREDPRLPAPAMGGAAVELEWSSVPPIATRSDGKVKISFPQQVKVTALPPNTSLKLSGFGLRAAHMTLTQENESDIAIERGEAPEDGGSGEEDDSPQD